MTDIRREILRKYVSRLKAAQHGGKGTIFDECADYFGWSRQKAIRELKAAGYETYRKPRSDRGKTMISEETLAHIAALQHSATTRTGKDTLHVTGAYSIAASTGTDIGVSVARIRQLLKNHHLDRKSLSRPSPHIHMRSLYPNHVHQVDPSLSRLYYAPQGLARIEDAQANRNKVDGFKKLKLWRYVLTDHYSGSVVIRYYETNGENQANLFDFLLYAWGKKQHDLFRFHGLPDILLWDSGSANISRAMTYALKALDVDARPHGVERPRVKGQVEKHNDLAEMFEARLRLQPQLTVDMINKYAETWCAAYNANAIPRYDSRLRRNGSRIVRLESWLTIATGQLRELPPLQVCRDLLTREPKQVTVRNDLFISHEGRIYSLAGLPGVYVGMKVFVQPLLMREKNTLKVHYKNECDEEVSIEVIPLAIDEQSGFFVESAVIGRTYKSHRKTVLETNAEMLNDRVGDPVIPFAGKIQALSVFDSIENDAVYMPRTGTPVTITGSRIFDNILTPVQAANHLKRSLGWWNATCMEYLQNRYPTGIKESELPQIQVHFERANENDIGSQTSVA